MLTTKEIGDALEKHVLKLLDNETSQASLWKDISGSDLLDSGLYKDFEIIRKNRHALKNNAENLTIDECKNLFRDIGIDILQFVDGKYIYIQCKCYGKNNTISVDKLATFGMRLPCNPSGHGAVYYTGKISNDAMQIFGCYKNIKVDFINLTNEYKTILPPTTTPLLTNEISIIQQPIIKSSVVKYVLHNYQKNRS